MTDVERIAASLTKAQREALLDAYSPWGDGWKVNASGRTANILFERGLIDHNEMLTSLGEQARTHLKENENAG